MLISHSYIICHINLNNQRVRNTAWKSQAFPDLDVFLLFNALQHLTPFLDKWGCSAWSYVIVYTVYIYIDCTYTNYCAIAIIIAYIYTIVDVYIIMYIIYGIIEIYGIDGPLDLYVYLWIVEDGTGSTRVLWCKFLESIHLVRRSSILHQLFFPNTLRITRAMNKKLQL